MQLSPAATSTTTTPVRTLGAIPPTDQLRTDHQWGTVPARCLPEVNDGVVRFASASLRLRRRAATA
jgi:hypothetical protein